MSRIQQSRSGKRQRPEKLDAASLKSALRAAIEKRGIALPRFGTFNIRANENRKTEDRN